MGGCATHLDHGLRGHRLPVGHASNSVGAEQLSHDPLLPKRPPRARPPHDDGRPLLPPISTETWTESVPSTFTDFPTGSREVRTAKSRDRPSMLTAEV